MIDASTPPDLVLDFTIGGPNSEVVQIHNLLACILVKLEIKKYMSAAPWFWIAIYIFLLERELSLNS